VERLLEKQLLLSVLVRFVELMNWLAVWEKRG